MAELRFDDRVAIVTGGGNGLGRAHALLLGARGAKVLVNDYGGDVRGEGGSAGPAEAVALEIEKAGGVAAADAHSVAASEGGRAIVEAALERWGRVDVVVHNAGIGGPSKSFEDLPDDQLDRVLRTHLYGAFNVLRPAWRVMKERGYGRIVNTSSSTALGVDGSWDYPSAKAGLIGLSRALALDGAAHGIKVNVLMPMAYTRMSAGVPNEAIRKWMEETFPVHKVAPLVAWLCHEDVPCSGEILSCGAGRSARIVTAVARGFQEEEPTPESIRDHWDEVMDSGDLSVALAGSVDAAMFAESWQSLDDASLVGDREVE